MARHATQNRRSDSGTDRRLFCFGLGYSASALAESLLAEGWAVAGTARTEEGCAALRARGVAAHRYAQIGRAHV